jgi:hypothetical protein
MNKSSTLATHKSMITGQRLRQEVLMVGFTVFAESRINMLENLGGGNPLEPVVRFF